MNETHLLFLPVYFPTGLTFYLPYFNSLILFSIIYSLLDLIFVLIITFFFFFNTSVLALSADKPWHYAVIPPLSTK